MTVPLRILVLDDEENIRKSLGTFLRMHGYESDTAAVHTEALKKLQEGGFQILITDVKMPDKNGIELTEEVSRRFPELTILVVTAYGDVRDAVRAMKQGAYEYLTKPIDQEELLIILGRIAEHYAQIWEIRELRRKLKTESPYPGLVGSSDAIRDTYALIDKASRSDYSVLISGETGTGKEIVANAIHHNSGRSRGPLVAVNCGALSETMMESELFGHLQGAFTGAVSHRLGRIRSADGGTLFLDEIGTLSPAAQVKLLRVLDEKTFEPLGSDTPIKVDIRVVAATNEDLSRAVREGRFREDLYYRLNVIQIDLPPLRDRKEDIPLLARHVLNQLGRREVKISSGAMNLLLRYDWPGNIRQLENVLKSALTQVEGDTMIFEHLPGYFAAGEGASAPEFAHLTSFKEKVELFEKYLIEEALRQTSGNITQAARQLDFPLRSFRRKMERYGVKGGPGT
ncbi:MAG TPA: sigma-54 dependent transcriptional regulator [bacterium]|nr:sigma-54 dependent transcriptional regulator [bacterium]HPJ72430.1 sigma-54 dependent transcriptional regulator [bacterium]HPQ65383.1 sigma-54 dependent transcriptional regulator [bacterium]